MGICITDKNFAEFLRSGGGELIYENEDYIITTLSWMWDHMWEVKNKHTGESFVFNQYEMKRYG